MGVTIGSLASELPKTFTAAHSAPSIRTASTVLRNMRSEILKQIATLIDFRSRNIDRTLLVGIDGNDGSGKSYFAKELSEAVSDRNVTAEVCSIDNFHNKKAVRYKKGRNSALGFFEDSHNMDFLKSELLEPVRDGQKMVKRGVFDCASDQEIIQVLDISKIDVVLFEGLFLHRDELQGFWDMSIYLSTDFSVSVARGNARFGLNLDPEHESNARYVEGNRIYQRKCQPLIRAGIVVDNNDLNNARIISNRYGQQTPT